MQRKALAKVTIWLLTASGAFSLYQTLFCLWMTSHPLYHSTQWTSRFFIRLGTTVVISVLWFVLAIWLFKHREKSKEPSVEP